MKAGPSPLTTVPRPREDGEQEVMAPMQWRDATVGVQDTTGLSLVLPCTEDPELFFAESPQDVEQAKAMCRGCRARLACLAGALERREPWGVWGGELLMSGAIVPRKRPRGRPRKDLVTRAPAAEIASDTSELLRRFAAQLSVSDAAVLLGVSKGRITSCEGGRQEVHLAAPNRHGWIGMPVRPPSPKIRSLAWRDQEPASGNWTGLPGGSHKGPFGPKIAGRTRALNSSSVRYRSAPPEKAVASWSSADRSSGRSGTGGSAVAQRLTATCAAAVTAPARTCGYMSCSTSIPVLAAIASAKTSCIAELTFR